MIYNFDEYICVFDTPMKRIQESAIAKAIMQILNKNKYDNLEEFITKNKNYQDFFKKFIDEPIILHFKNELKNVKEEDYIKILENLRTHTKEKQRFETENIKTTKINDKQFNSFKGEDKTYFIDNSNTTKSIEEQMKDLQPTQQDFQTTDAKQNTENMFKELERKKETLNLNYLHEINYDLLNNEEKELYQVADEYQQKQPTDTVIRVDLEKGIIADELDNIMKIEKENGKFSIIKEENGIKKDEQIKPKTFQKTLTPSKNTIYGN